MRSPVTLISSILLTIVLSLALAIALPAGKAHGFKSGGPTSVNVEGVSVCAGPPTSGNIFEYNGTNWCDRSTMGPPLTFSTATAPTGANAQIGQSTNGAGTLFLNSANSGNGIEFWINGTRDFILSPAGFQGIGAGSQTAVLQWGISGGDLAESNAPRSTFSGSWFLAASAPAANVILGGYQNTKAIHVRAITCTLPEGGGAACATFPIVGIYANGTHQAGCDVTLSASTAPLSTTGCTIAIAATGLAEIGNTNAAACTSKAEFSCNAEFTTD